MPAAAAAGTVLYALSPALAPGATLPVACILLTGVCYGWLEARLFFEAVIHSLSLSVELLSHFLFWLAGVMAARTLEWPPLRSTAMAELVMSSAAILFSLILQAASGLGRFIVIAALYGAVAVLMAVVWKAWQTGHEATEAASVSDLTEACALIAAERNLSPREAEVLVLLAVGRSRTFIMEQFVISDATVKSHTNHIYQKLGIHSKQELITLVRER